jgi:hypothetical protein
MAKSTSEQRFSKIFATFIDPATQPNVHANAERAMDRWLKDHGKTRADIKAILAKAQADDVAAQPPPPPSDPRDTAPHPFDDPKFTPAGLVEGIVAKYVTMSEHVSVISSLWTCLTHVYMQFAIAPRVALVSAESVCGKSTLRKVARHLVYRPNRAALSTCAAIERFLDQGPGTAMLDEVDNTDAEAKPRLRRIWNEGFERGAETALVIGGREKFFSIYAPMLVAGIGNKFLVQSQMTRTFVLDMQRYTEQTKPERNYRVNPDIGEFDAVYSFIRHWAANVKLDPDPTMPPGILDRHADNARGLLSIADSCGPVWGQRAREAVLSLLEKEKAELPQHILVRHGLLIFAVLEPEDDQIGTVLFNQELKRLDLPDAMWGRYRGPDGAEIAHPITMQEQGALFSKVGVHSETCWPSGPRIRGGAFRGYKLAQFQEAQRKYGVAAPDETEVGRARLRLVKPQSD